MYNAKVTKYYNEKSDLHSMNPLCKLICLLLFTILVLFTNNIMLLSILFLFICSLIILSNVPLKMYLHNFMFSLGIILFIVVINIITKVSFTSTIISILKILMFIIYSSILIYTTTSQDLVYGLNKLLKPLRFFGVNTNSMAMTISLAIKFIPMTFLQFNKILKSQQSRGLEFSGSLKEKCDKILSLIIPTFTNALDKSDKLSETLDIRLYNSLSNRNEYKSYMITEIDESILCMHGLITLIFVIGGFIL